MSAIIPFPFDFKNPDYISVFKWRLDRLKKLRANPELFEYSKHFYKNNPGQFIVDWGCTFDPRNIELGLPAIIPFVLFPRQVEWVDFFMYQYKNKKNSITEKSRDMGVSWLSIALATSLCLFNDDFIAGFGSRKEIYVDKRGDPKSILEKSRMFLRNLPKEFTGNWNGTCNAVCSCFLRKGIRFISTNQRVGKFEGFHSIRASKCHYYHIVIIC